MSAWEDPFPFVTAMSLDLLIERFERLAEDDASPWRAMARDILNDLERVPELRGTISDPGILETEADLVARMMTAVFPFAGGEHIMGAAVEPFRLSPLFQTKRGKELELFEMDLLMARTTVHPDQVAAGKTLSAYQHVLRQFYGVEIDYDFPIVVTISDDRGLKTHLQFSWSTEFLTVEPVDGIPNLSEEDLARLLESPLDTEAMVSILPASAFRFRGFTVITATDVTTREVISRLKDDLIPRDAMATPARIDVLQHRVRNLVRSPEAVLGFFALDRCDRPGNIERARAVGRSLLVSDHVPHCPERENSWYVEAAKSNEPVVIHDLSGEAVRSGLEATLVKQGFRSLLLCPLRVDGRLIGMLELASPNPGEMNAFTALQVGDAAALFTTAVLRALDEESDHIESVIKKHYTAIHPSVEWRFQEAAAEIIKNSGASVAVPEVVFEDVYPLYGLADIRGSSDRRNAAIQADLETQLALALAAVQAGAAAKPMTVLDEVAYRIGQYVQKIQDGLRSEDERGALELLVRDVEPLFDRIAGFSPGAKARVEAYRGSLDSKLGVVYERRRAFEESVASINNLVAHTISQEERATQAMVPHLFESFQTDGVDYNIYVGGSLLASGDFDPLFLRDLRLWQLKLHCQIEWETREKLVGLGEPMELTHLVLVQDHPLSIRFRIDEKRFDVDGAYNIRYEIIKKRIDKARIRDTGERLTQPGMLAIVYSQPQEAAEYGRYLDYLIAAGYLAGPIETVELEDLQGVYGLRAFRVMIAERPAGRPQVDIPEAVAQRMGQSVGAP